MSNSNYNVFLVTKPLQFIIVLNIIYDYKLENNTVIILDSFSKAEVFFLNLTKYKNNKNITYVFKKTKLKAVFFIVQNWFNNVYLDSDVGFKNYVFSFLIKIFSFNKKIFVYEEGIATYNRSFYKNVKLFILNAIGAGTNFGGSIFTNGIYLYFPEKYLINVNIKAKKIYKIQTTFSDFIENHKNDIEYYFNLTNFFTSLHLIKFKKRVCFVYLGTWGNDKNDFLIDKNLIDTIFTDNEKYMIFIKRHPNISHRNRISINLEHLEVPPIIPAEILISFLSIIFNNVVVFHHDSSVSQYTNKENINYKNLYYFD